MVRAYVIHAQHNFDDDFVVIESLEDFDFVVIESLEDFDFVVIESLEDDDFVVIESLEDFDFWGGTIRHTEKNNTQKKRYSRTGAHKYRVCTTSVCVSGVRL